MAHRNVARAAEHSAQDTVAIAATPVPDVFKAADPHAATMDTARTRAADDPTAVAATVTTAKAGTIDVADAIMVVPMATETTRAGPIAAGATAATVTTAHTEGPMVTTVDRRNSPADLASGRRVATTTAADPLRQAVATRAAATDGRPNSPADPASARRVATTTVVDPRRRAVATRAIAIEAVAVIGIGKTTDQAPDAAEAAARFDLVTKDEPRLVTTTRSTGQPTASC